MEPTIVTLRGDYDIARLAQLRRELEPTHRDRYVVLDLTHVTYIDSTCLCEFMRMRKMRADAGLHPACFVVGDERFGRLFRFLGLDEIFTVAASLDDALVRELQPA
jgi:anti-anti-sigma factor